MFVAASAGMSSEEEQSKSVQIKAPLGAEFYLSQNVSAGTFIKRYSQDPYVATELFVYPYYQYGPFLGDRAIKVQAELSTIFAWMSENNPFPGQFTKKFGLRDAKIRAEFKNAIYSSSLGLSFSPGLKAELPMSKSSRTSNRVLGLGGFFTAAWTNWGFFVSYKPVLVGYIHSVPYKSADCAQASAPHDVLSDGSCKLAERQSMALLKNTVSIGYAHEAHTIKLALRVYHAFLRAKGQNEPVKKGPESGILEQTLGIVEYAYQLPVAIPTTLMLGVSGEQSYYDARHHFRIPFFDFTEPGKNVTEAYLAVNMAF